MAKISKAEREESIKALREILRKGDTIRAVCRNWNSRSGSSRWDFYKIGKRGEISNLTYHMARACGFTLRDAEIGFPYLNMDPAFHAVYTLGATIFPARVIRCDRCQGAGHRTQQVRNPDLYADAGNQRPHVPFWIDKDAECVDCYGKGRRRVDGGYYLQVERL